MDKTRVPRFPPKRILVPLDAHDASLYAWKQAQALAKRLGARVQGLYAQDWSFSARTQPYFQTRDPGNVLSALRSRLGAGADVRRVEGPVEETILSWGKNLKFDLIVMGTHGRTGLDRALKGSVAEYIVRYSSVPVLVARQTPSRYRTVLAPVNFEPYSMDGLLFAAKTAAALKARLTVLHVNGAPFYSDADPVASPKKLIAGFIARLPADLRKACRPRALLVFGQPLEEIIAASEQADLVVLAAHRKGFLHDAILGTTAEGVLRHCRKPVLSVPVASAKRRGYAAGDWESK